MQREVQDLVIDECIPNCEQCPSVWVNEQIAHRIVCRCSKCERHKTEVGSRSPTVSTPNHQAQPSGIKSATSVAYQQVKLSQPLARDNNTLINDDLNKDSSVEQLKALGVKTFVRQSNVINVNFKEGPMVVVQLDQKRLTNTSDAFEKEALRYPHLSKDIVNNVLLFLMDVNNGYLQYLLYNKSEELNGESHKESSHTQILSSKGSAARLAIKLAKQHCQDFFIDNLGQPHVAVKVDKHIEVLPIKSSRLRTGYAKFSLIIPQKDITELVIKTANLRKYIL
jgi:hypothetical protein